MKDRTSFIISLIIHFALIAFFVISPNARFENKRTYLPVDLAAPQPIEEKQPEPKKTVKPQPKEEDKITHKKNTPKPTKKPKPTPKKPTPTPTKKKISENLKKKLQKLLTPKPTKPKPTPTPKKTEKPTPTPFDEKIPITDVGKRNSANEVKSASEYQFTIDHGDSKADFVPYARKIEGIFKRNWLTPTVKRPEMREYVTVISFTVKRSGVISEVKIDKQSGWALMDKTVLESIKRSNPLPPLPKSYASDTIRVQFPFRLLLN
ncbi:TonB family protein [bacterium]|nr:TonB family protein [bacterium]